MNYHFVYRQKKSDKNQTKYVKLVRGTQLLKFLIIVIDHNYKTFRIIYTLISPPFLMAFTFKN